MTEYQGISIEDNIKAMQKELREKGYKRSWTPENVLMTFDMIGHTAGVCSVIRKSDKATGTLNYTNSPRVYFNFRKG
jgi:hypothetical protein